MGPVVSAAFEAELQKIAKSRKGEPYPRTPVAGSVGQIAGHAARLTRNIGRDVKRGFESTATDTAAARTAYLRDKGRAEWRRDNAFGPFKKQVKASADQERESAEKTYRRARTEQRKHASEHDRGIHKLAGENESEDKVHGHTLKRVGVGAGIGAGLGALLAVATRRQRHNLLKRMVGATDDEIPSAAESALEGAVGGAGTGALGGFGYDLGVRSGYTEAKDGKKRIVTPGNVAATLFLGPVGPANMAGRVVGHDAARSKRKHASVRGPGIEKIAAIWGCALKSPGYYGAPCSPGGADSKWSDKFTGTPFAKRALSLEKAEADREIAYAQQAVEDAHAQVKEAQHRAKIATLESKLLGWKAEQGGEKEKKAMQEKLAACCPGREFEWSDHFKNSPFYKDAMRLEAEDAHMEVERTARSIKDSARWRGNDEDRLERKKLEAEFADYKVSAMGL